MFSLMCTGRLTNGVRRADLYHVPSGAIILNPPSMYRWLTVRMSHVLSEALFKE